MLPIGPDGTGSKTFYGPNGQPMTQEEFEAFASANEVNSATNDIISGQGQGSSTTDSEGSGLTEFWNDVVGDRDEGIASLSEYLRNNPDASPEDAMKYMANYSDEWAEKYLDYLNDKEGIRYANEYNASREDTAYQRLVADLKAAGLNPALMYGNSASPVGTASSGVYNSSGSASNSRISNYDKLKQLLLASVLAQWQIQYQTTSNNMKGVSIISKLFLGLLGLAGPDA